jgi:aerobic carbon-monoxide dehydrogenase medium subunit
MARVVPVQTVEEACALLGEPGKSASVIAGGTALQMLRRRGEFAAQVLVDLRCVNGLDRIETADGHLSFGACVTHRQIETHTEVQGRLPVLGEVFSQIANVRVRNVATIGGNLAHPDYRLDPPGVLLVLGAWVDIASREGSRSVGVAELFTHTGEKALRSDEVIVAIHLPVPKASSKLAFRKYKSLGANDWPCISVAGMLTAHGDGARVLDLGLTAAAPTPLHLRLDVSALGLSEVLDNARTAVCEAIDPPGDLRGTPAFKRRVAEVVAADTIRSLWQEANR